MKLKEIRTTPFFNILLPVILLQVATLLYLFFFWSKILPPTIPLWYGRPVGPDQLAPGSLIVAPVFLSLVLSFVGVVLVNIADDKFIRQVLVSLVYVTTIFSLIAVFRIVILVGIY